MFWNVLFQSYWTINATRIIFVSLNISSTLFLDTVCMALTIGFGIIYQTNQPLR